MQLADAGCDAVLKDGRRCNLLERLRLVGLVHICADQLPQLCVFLHLTLESKLTQHIVRLLNLYQFTLAVSGTEHVCDQALDVQAIQSAHHANLIVGGRHAILVDTQAKASLHLSQHLVHLKHQPGSELAKLKLMHDVA